MNAPPRPRFAGLLRALKILVAAGLAAALLAVGALALFALSFNPNQYKQTLIDAVREREHRTLSLPGTLRMELFPPLTLRTGPIALSERDQPDVPFARADDLLLHLDLFALLKWRLAVDRVLMVHPLVHVRRDAQGRFNFADLLPDAQKPAATPSPLKLSIARIDMQRGTVTYDDAGADVHGQLADLDLQAAGLAGGSAQPLHLAALATLQQPALRTRIELRGKLQLDPDSGRGSLRDLALSLQGDGLGLKAAQALASGALDWTLPAVAPAADAAARPTSAASSALLQVRNWTLKGSAQLGGQRVDARLAVPDLALQNGGKLQLGAVAASAEWDKGPRLTLALPAAQGTLQALSFAAARLTAESGPAAQPDWRLQLASPLQATPVARRIDLTDLHLDGRIVRLGRQPLPQPQTVALAGKGQLDLTAGSAAAQLSGKLGASAVQTQLAWAKQTLSGQIGVDHLTLADWQPRPAPRTASAAADQPARIDLAPLRGVALDLQTQIGQLDAAGTSWQKVQATLQSDGQTLNLAPVSAQGYGGQVSGSAAVDLAAQRYTLQASATHLSLAPLLTAATDRALLRGTADASAGLQAQGDTVSALVRSASGRVRLDVHDGALAGFDLPAVLRGGAVAAARRNVELTPALQQSTAFSALGATFAVDRGVATTADLHGQSPLLRLAGAGSIDFPAQRLQFTLLPALAGSLPGLSAAANAGLRGVEVPVVVSGPFARPSAQVMWADAGGRLLRYQIDQRVREGLQRELPGGAVPRLPSLPPGLGGLLR